MRSLGSLMAALGYRLAARRFGGVTYKPNGERECARRRRQIASGQLTSANGLVREGSQ